MDVEALTAAFMEAHYTTREIDPARVPRAQAIWLRVMQTLRRPSATSAAQE